MQVFAQLTTDDGNRSACVLIDLQKLARLQFVKTLSCHLDVSHTCLLNNKLRNKQFEVRTRLAHHSRVICGCAAVTKSRLGLAVK